MQERKRLEEFLAQEKSVAAQASDLDTMFELVREGEASVLPDLQRDLHAFGAYVDKL